MSCAEIVSVLFFDEMRFDPQATRAAATQDVFVLSKGHAAPILWAVLKEAGAIADDLLTLRRLRQPARGPSDAALAVGARGDGLARPGALRGRGHGLGAQARRQPGRASTRSSGDGEAAEGSVWEAAQFASFNGLDNLCAIVDVNRLGQSGPTMYEHDIGRLRGALRGLRLGGGRRWTATTSPPLRDAFARARGALRPALRRSWRARSRARASRSSRTRTAGTASP